MTDETYPDSLPFEVLDIIGRTVFGKNRSTTLAASAANAMQEAHRLGYLLVPVPDGMSVEDAEKALAEHVAWVPLPEGVRIPDGVRARQEWTYGGEGPIRVLVHSDDLPVDPDAELIEAMAQKMADRHEYPEWHGLFEGDRDLWRSHARAALAVVREHEAGQR